MLPTKHAYRHAAREARSIPEAIWITNDVLVAAFDRFAAATIHGGIRHGSSVPGPLEAQRRLAKRRMSLSPNEGSQTLNIGHFMNGGRAVGPPLLTWMPPAAAKEKPATSQQRTPLPSWLTDCLPDTEEILSTVTAADAPDAIATNEEDRTSMPGVTPIEFRQQILAATDVSQIHGIARNYGISCLSTEFAECSALIFDRLLQLRASSHQLLDCLKDRDINASDAFNIDRILSHAEKHDATKETLQNLDTMLVALVQRGLVSSNDLEAVFTKWPRIASKAFATVQEAATNTRTIFVNIWEALWSSSHLSVQDLDAPTIDLLFCQLAIQPFSAELVTIVTDVVRDASAAQLQVARKGLSEFLVCWIQGWRENTPLDTARLPSMEPIPGMGDLLQRLPENVCRLVVGCATAKLKKQVHSNLHPQLLYSWIATVDACPAISKCGLTSGEWSALETLLVNSFSLDQVIPYLSSRNHLETARFVLVHLIRAELQKQPSPGTGATQRFASLRRHFGIFCKSHKQSHYASIVLALHRVGCLPGDIAKHTQILFSILEKLGRRSELKDLINFLGKERLGVPSHVLQAASRNLHQSDQVHFITSRTTCDPSSYSKRDQKAAALIFSLIQKSSLHPQQIWDILKRKGFLAVKDDQMNSRSSVESTARCIHHLALSVAHKPEISARVAFRYVRRCFNLLQSASIPMNRNISRALTHAGVTRQLQERQWVSTMKLRFILDQVRELEGDEVATRVDETVYEWRGRNIASYSGKGKPE